MRVFDKKKDFCHSTDRTFGQHAVFGHAIVPDPYGPGQRSCLACGMSVDLHGEVGKICVTREPSR